MKFYNINNNNLNMIQRLELLYYDKIRPQLYDLYKFKNMNQVPKLEKIIINRGLGDASQNAKLLETCNNEISIISGQKGVITRSKRPIAAFKLRKNMPVGIIVTLRRNHMYSFLDRLINLALPRIRDFQGINPKSFDRNGNLNIGLNEQLVFPEINYNDIVQFRGMDVSIITTTKNDAVAMKLLREFGMPFKL
uniref:ribosomal protein L5 n=1 Tax=Prototheca fontanea TaxID=2836215 RepID=UPI00300192C1